MGASFRLIVSMLIFGSMGLFVKPVDLPVSVIALARGAFGLVFLLLAIRLMGRSVSGLAIRRNLAVLAVSGLTLGADWVFLFEAFKRTTIATATVTYYLAPILMVAVSPFILKEKLSPLKVFCIFVALAGLILVSGLLEPSGRGGDYSGVAFALAAAVCYVVFTMLNKILERISALDATLAQIGIAALTIVPYMLLTTDFNRVPAPGGSDLALLAALGGLHTCLAFYLYFSSLQELKAQTIAVFSYIEPITAVLLSSLLLREELSLMAIMGAVLIVGSAGVSELFGRSRPVKTVPAGSSQAA